MRYELEMFIFYLIIFCTLFGLEQGSYLHLHSVKENIMWSYFYNYILNDLKISESQNKKSYFYFIVGTGVGVCDSCDGGDGKTVYIPNHI